MRHTVVLISGRQGSGKSTLQKKIITELNSLSNSEAVAINFADPIYEMQDAVQDVIGKYLPLKRKKRGKLMQYLGTEFGRDELGPELELGPDLWVEIAAIKIDAFLFHPTSLHTHNRIAVVGDTRFKNELRMTDRLSKPIDVVRVRLEAPRDIRKERCQGWRDTELHLSETDLDTELHRFDLVLDTSKSFEETWSLTKTYLFGRGLISI